MVKILVDRTGPLLWRKKNRDAMQSWSVAGDCLSGLRLLRIHRKQSTPGDFIPQNSRFDRLDQHRYATRLYLARFFGVDCRADDNPHRIEAGDFFEQCPESVLPGCAPQ